MERRCAFRVGVSPVGPRQVLVCWVHIRRLRQYPLWVPPWTDDSQELNDLLQEVCFLTLMSDVSWLEPHDALLP